MRPMIRPEVVRLDLGDDDWVELKGGFDTGDKQAIQDAMNVVSTDGSGVALHIGSANRVSLKRAIKAWGGPHFQDEKGKVLPITYENIAMLPPEASAAIVKRINELNVEPDKESADPLDDPEPRN